jgi:TM2 domain-containing membrane protein YozV
MKVPDSAVGKKVKCPKCEALVPVPPSAPATAPVSSEVAFAPPEEPQLPARTKQSRDYDDEDYEEDYEERPRKSKRKSSGGASSDVSSKKIAAAICGILIGALGIHKFVLGYTSAGLIMLLVTVLTCGMGGMVMGIIGLVEGIIYLTKSDEEFYETYIRNEKPWF